MKITTELSIREFNAWSGAIDTKNVIIESGKADEFDQLIEEIYPEGISDVYLNDLLWFDANWILETLGISEVEETEEKEEDNEILKLIKGYFIYISGTWCEVTKGNELIFEGSVKSGTTAEEIAEYLNL